MSIAQITLRLAGSLRSLAESQLQTQASGSAGIAGGDVSSIDRHRADPGKAGRRLAATQRATATRLVGGQHGGRTQEAF
jgi:hypothetical protein